MSGSQRRNIRLSLSLQESSSVLVLSLDTLKRFGYSLSMNNNFATYSIRIKDNDAMTVTAGSHDTAAVIAGRRLYGRTVTVQRVTGVTGKSGVFAAYRYDRKLSASNQIGSEFHVR
jgi:hypothetical protein